MLREDFMTELADVQETQYEMKNVLQFIEFEPLFAEYAAFLAMPLETEERKASGNTALCHLFGFQETFSFKRNWRVIGEAREKATALAQSIWFPDEQKTFVKFPARLISPSECDQEQQRRNDILEMAASEPALQQLVKTFWQEHDRYDFRYM
ncbi:hypothetical protein GGR57DRAFT_496726 [Xylariaceae sp. FL1272]|nr:hypothetical protein GGR57DRAFT_496726 [Xylariaceae sp. FL1272]